MKDYIDDHTLVFQKKREKEEGYNLTLLSTIVGESLISITMKKILLEMVFYHLTKDFTF